MRLLLKFFSARFLFIDTAIMHKTYWYALATLMGSIIGVGLFGLPYTAKVSGFWIVVAYFIVLTTLLVTLHLMYGELALQVKDHHQFPGYVALFLGPRWKTAALISIFLGANGGLLAYLIVGGQFLAQLATPLFGGSLLLYQMIYYLAGAYLIYKGIQSVAKAEFVMFIVFMALVFILFVMSIFKLEVSHFATLDLQHFFFPYGVIIFALWGVDSIPTLKEYLSRDARLLKKVIFHGVILSAITYLIFIISILGMSGSETSIDAVSGLLPYFSNNILSGAYLFGILTTFTSFIAIGLVLKKTFQSDYTMPHELAWFLSLFPALVLFSLGLNNFFMVISITGAVMLAFQGTLIALMYRKLTRQPHFKPQFKFTVPSTVVYAMILILVSGIFTEIFLTLSRG